MKPVILLLALLASACDVALPATQGRSMTAQEIRDYYDALGESTFYFRDPKTGECFAQPGGPGNPITSVECTEEVMERLVNAQTSLADADVP